MTSSKYKHRYWLNKQRLKSSIIYESHLRLYRHLTLFCHQFSSKFWCFLPYYSGWQKSFIWKVLYLCSMNYLISLILIHLPYFINSINSMLNVFPMNRATFDYRCAVPTINIFRVYWNSRHQRIFSTQIFSVLDRLIYKDFNANHLVYIVPRWYSGRIYADCL